MKTLIINGSPKKNGDTAALVERLVNQLDGEKKIVTCYDDISPCMDCRYCWKNSGCAVKDGMQEVYAYLKECDNVVLASPVWYSSLSGPLLNITSRLQAIFAARRFRGEKRQGKRKNGVLILVGGEKGTEAAPTEAALTIMKLMNVDYASVRRIYSMDTDNLPAAKDEAAAAQIREAAAALNAYDGR